MSDGHYLGDTLVWNLEDDGARARYYAIRPTRSRVPTIAFLSLLSAYFAAGALLSGGLGLLAIVAVAGLASETACLLVEKRHPITTVTIRLHSESIWVQEGSNKPWPFRDRPMRRICTRRIKSMLWTGSGCTVLFCRGHFGETKFCLVHELFSDEQAIAALYRWAEHHGITIEGPPPIPGAYVRSIQ